MTEDRFIPYEDALSTQGANLERVRERLLEQGDEIAGLGQASRPLFVGIGASHAASALPVHLLRRGGIAAHRVSAGDVPAGTPALGDVVVGVSQSGRSRETIDHLLSTDVRKAAVVNVPGSPLAQLAPTAVDLGGQRDSKASTIGFTGTLLALGLLADRWTSGAGTRPGAAWTSEAVDLQQVVGDLEGRTQPALARLAETVSAASTVDVVGHEASVATAEEGALLLREVCRVPAAAFDLRNYLHGAEESAAPGRTVHLVVGRDRARELAEAMSARGLSVSLVTDLPDEATASLVAAGVPVVTVPVVDDTTRVILETIVMQRLALMVARHRDVPPDDFLATVLDTKVEDLAQLGAGSA